MVVGAEIVYFFNGVSCHRQNLPGNREVNPGISPSVTAVYLKYNLQGPVYVMLNLLKFQFNKPAVVVPESFMPLKIGHSH